MGVLKEIRPNDAGERTKNEMQNKMTTKKVSKVMKVMMKTMVTTKEEKGEEESTLCLKFVRMISVVVAEGEEGGEEDHFLECVAVERKRRRKGRSEVVRRRSSLVLKL